MKESKRLKGGKMAWFINILFRLACTMKEMTDNRHTCFVFPGVY